MRETVARSHAGSFQSFLALHFNLGCYEHCALVSRRQLRELGDG
jgi:hypothetical protein